MAEFDERAGDRLERAATTALADDALTAETLFARIAALDPALTARGLPWLETQLARSRAVTVLADGRYALCPDEEDAHVAPPTIEPATRPPVDIAIANRYVVFDFESNADRSDVAEHEIIEIGACLVEGGVVVDEFQTFARPTRPLLHEISELTGLHASDMEDAPELADALRRFLDFAAGAPLVAHNGFGYDFRLLDASCARAGIESSLSTRLDTLELAHVVEPRIGAQSLPSRDGSVPPVGRALSELAAHYDIPTDGQLHRALDDARLTVAVLHRMVTDLDARKPHRDLQRWVLTRGGHPWAAFVAPPEDERPSLEDVIEEPEAWPVLTATGRIDLDAAAAPLRPGGALLTDGRVHRAQQVTMAELVADALAHDQRRMIEAPTGTGKTLAYLVPAVAMARALGAPVVVATHSKVLQNQVLTSIPELERAYGPVRMVLLKGRENYLSVDALDGVLDGPIGDDDEALALAVLCGWAATTPTGEWDDLRAWNIDHRSPALATLRWRVRVDEYNPFPNGTLDERCFYRTALERVGRAEIAVLNHAVLVSRNDWLEGSKHLVLDEAHNLEESATGALTEEVNQRSLGQLFDAVHDPSRRWGTIGRYVDATSGSVKDDAPAAALAALAECRSAAQRIAGVLVDYVRDRAGARRAEVEQYGAAYRVRRGVDTNRPDYRLVQATGNTLATALGGLAVRLGELTLPSEIKSRYRRDRLEAEIARVARTAREASRFISEVLGCREDDWIYVADLTIHDDQWRWGLRKIPLSVAPVLRDLWGALHASVLTSATLRVGGEFEHLLGRLGLDGAQCTPLDTPFTRLHENELVVLPDHLPSPRGGLLDEFTHAEAQEVGRLLTLTSGRGLVLFTARSRMAHVRDHVRPLLEPLQIPVLCQGEEPSPALVERMREERTTSLLATRSFWEGIDVPGDSLSLLVIEKVPFDSPGDPVVAARMDAVELQGRDPFADFLVPQAVLRFVQGVGRLIRTEGDRGVVVLLDKRLRRPLPYRERFIRSLPGPPRFSRPVTADEGYREIASHLDVDLTDDLWERLRSIPSSDPWGDIEELALSDDDIRDADVVRERLDEVRARLGFAAWRPGQLEVIERFVRGDDVLAVLPTGSGKSLTYQIPAMVRPGLTLVISPLVALMRDQVKGMHARGMLKINAIYSGQAQSEQDDILAGARGGRYKVLYVSPERLWSKKFRQSLRGIRVARVAVDEAHCISQWGHSFRPEYAAIRQAVKEIAAEQGRPPMLAVTATATPRVRDEIRELLGLDPASAPIVRSPDRPELRYYVEDCASVDERDVAVARVVEAFRGQPMIVYVPRRDDTLRVATLLRSANHLARPYHGGMEPGQRIHVEEAFRYGEVDVVVATKAFGLGIDKPDIAAIVHLEMPASVEEYVQETGRAARGAVDGVGPESGVCVLLRMKGDCRIHRQFIRGAAPDLKIVKQVWDALTGDGGDEVITPPEDLAAKVGLDDDGREAVALAVHHLVSSGAIERLEDLSWEGRVWIPSDVDHVLEAIERTDAELARRARDFIRAIRDVGTEHFELRAWSERLRCPAEQVETDLLELHHRDVLGFTTWRAAWHLKRRAGVEPDWAEIEANCAERRHLVEQLSADAKAFAKADQTCRRARMVRYLGIDAADRCDGCDVCRPDLDRPWARVQLSAEDLVAALPTTEVVLALLDDFRHARFSEHTVARALAGLEGKGKSGESLRNHPTFGRLALLKPAGVITELERLAAEGLVEFVEETFEGSTYRSPRITDAGRKRL